MYIGTTPRGASDAAGVSAVDALYGVPPVMRLYNTGTLTAPVVNDRRVVGSFKSVSGATKLHMDMYYSVFYMHEIDAKIKKGQITLAKWKSDMATLKALGSTKLAVCVTADCFVNPSKNPSDYLIPGITHWGVDFDGISQGTYHDYTTARNNTISFASAHGLTIGVPEFEGDRISSDSSGTERSAWMIENMRSFQDAGFDYACYWEQTSQIPSPYSTPAEQYTVSSSIRLSPR